MRALYTRPLTLFAALFGLGVLFAMDGRLPLWALLLCGAGLLLAYALLRLGGRQCAALVAAAAVFLGAARMTQAVNAQPVVEDRFSVTISGTVADSPFVDAEIDRLTCRLTDVHAGGEPLGYDIRLYLRGSETALRTVSPGQTVTATAHLWAPDRSGNPGGFDFSAYLWRNGVAAYATANLADAEITGDPHGLAAALHAARSAMGERIDSLFPRSAQLVRALLLGDRGDMDERLRESFDRAGVTHVLSISGLHITLLAMALMSLLGLFLPRRWAFWVSLAVIVLYGALVGMAASVLRAILMYAALGAGQALGRPTDTLTRLALAFLLLLVWNPLYIADAGFVLSFSASSGMVCLSPALSRVLRVDKLRAPGYSLRPSALCRRAAHYLASLLCATLAAQLATLPAVIAYYGELPLLATLGNLVIVPLMLAGMYLSVVALLLSAIWLPLGAAAAPAADLTLHLSAQLTHLCAALPLNALALPAFPGWLTALYVCAVAAISEFSRLRKRLRTWLLLALPALACVAVLLPGPQGLQIVFLDAGQADAAVVLAEGEAYLVDVGLESSPADDYLAYMGLAPRAVFLSHPHEDHAGGLGEVLDNCPPETIYIPAGWYDVEADEGVNAALERARAMGVDIVELAAGDAVQLSANVVATALHPARGTETGGDANGISLLLKVDYGRASALFTGDLEMTEEPGPMPDVDVLKVPHHGSDNASSLRLLHSASPSAAVISVGAGNAYGHPAESLLGRLEGTGARVLRTDRDGAVTARLYEDGSVEISTYFTAEDGT